jgi:PAS domain S-box-containing protein
MVAISFFLYHLERQRCLVLWGVAWIFFSLRVAGDIALLSHPHSSLVFGLTQLANLGVGLFLALGSFAFVGQPVPRLLHAGAGAAAVLFLAPLLLGHSSLWTALPIFVFIGASACWTGMVILRSPELAGLGGRICGLALILWGLHRAVNNLLGAVESFAPTNYLLATLLTISVAVGLMLAYYQRTKSAQRLTETSYRQLLDSASDAFYVATADSQGGPIRFIEVNRAAHERLGYTREEFLTLGMADIVPARERPRIAEVSAILLGQGRASFEGIELTKDGREIPVDVRLHQTSRGRQTVTLSISRDISERKKAQAKLNELAAIVANSEDSIIGLDRHGVITSWNRGAARIYGYTSEEAIGQSMGLLMPLGQDDPDMELSHRVAQGQAVEGHETVRVTKTGLRRDVSVTMSPVRDENGLLIGASAIGRDITEVKQQQREREEIFEQLRQSQKMEALGTLAGGIAHDFNNLLGVILGYAEIAQQKQRAGEPAGRQIGQVVLASQRARDLVRQILTFSRRGKAERLPVVLGPLVAEALKMIRASIPSAVKIESELATPGDSVLADPTQIQQVLLNLCANAAQAMAPGGGVLRVRLEEVEVGLGHPLARAGLDAGPYFLLTVADTGPGMSPEVLGRALEPFFTTKPSGQGTGLGLSVVHGIVQSHGGWLSIHSQEGQGSTFEVWLARLAPAAYAAPPLAGETPRGQESILLVEDDPELCAVIAAQMEGLGYRVTPCTDSLAALRLLSHDHPCDLLFTDLVMPGLSGLELIRRAADLRPGLPVVVCTGQPEPPALDPVQLPHLRAVLGKPASLDQMGRAVRAAFSPPAGSPPDPS